MAYSAAIPAWTLNMPAGSLQQWTFTFTQALPATAPPYPITGATWEYVVRNSATDTGSPVFSITTVLSGSGQIFVTDTASTSAVLLDIAPSATASLTPGTYAHALWMNPSTSSAVTWMTGNLIIEGNPQP